MKRILIYGNSGTGKTTLARSKARAFNLAYLDLDTIAWSSPGFREDEAKSQESIQEFLSEHSEWVIEGCYGKMIRSLLPECTELHFLSPGVEASLKNNAAREWEPHKYASKAEQDARFEMLQSWVADYHSRDDEFSYRFHKELFSGFQGNKYEHTSLSEYDT